MTKELVFPELPKDVTGYSPNARRRAIENFVKANPGKIITMEDFNKAADVTAAIYYIKDLMQTGHLVRSNIKDGYRGKQYTYEWVDNPTPPSATKISPEVLDTLTLLAGQWQQQTSVGDNEEALAQKHLGVNQFINWIKEQQ